jgi:hypothetical protein
MIYTNTNSSFPSQVVTNEEKSSWEYGLRVARAIEGEWFGSGSGTSGGYRFNANYNNFHNLRLYARGEQSVQKYKNELSINGDLSYLNLDWKPVAIIPKFVDIVVNGMSEKLYDIKAYAQDPESMKKRTHYANIIHSDMQAQEFLTNMEEVLGTDMWSVQDKENLPANREDLALHMQLDYKQSVEVAQEEVINNTLARNKFDLVKRRFNYDLVVLGIGCVKTSWNKSNGVTVEYVDPANLVYSYTEDPNFEDIYYVGEVKNISLPELKKEFPNLTTEELERIQKYPGNTDYTRNWNGRNDRNNIQVLYFEYKSYVDQVFKIKRTANGLEKALQKTDIFDPPKSDTFNRASRSIETLWSGAKILGHNQMLQWGISETMTRPKANLTKVYMNYSICAPRMYKGRIQSLVNRITGYADMIQITHLKLQQVLARLVPDGVFVDVDGLAEVDLGDGTNYNPQEALNMYFQTGSIVGRSLTQEGDLNRGKVPVQELSSSSGQQKVASLINTYNYYLQMIRDVTGLNEARDGSTPNKDALVGLQKMAVNQSNTATRHLMQASLFLTLKACENITLRVSDTLEFGLTNEALQSAISSYNVGTLEDINELHLYDFGIYLELEPDEEEKAKLEENIQVALQSGGIDLEDAIDIRQIKNLKLANQLLKLKRKQKQQRDQEIQQANIEAQAQANAQAAEAAAMAETQKHQVITEQKQQLAQSESQMEIQRMQTESQIKREQMELQFQYDVQLKQMDVGEVQRKEQYIEDRKDKRTKLQATQQSELIDQRKNDLLPKNFERPDELSALNLQQLG